MISFIQFLLEIADAKYADDDIRNYHDKEWYSYDPKANPKRPEHKEHELYRHGIPAVKHKETGKITVGQRGKSHYWIVLNHHKGKKSTDFERGFHHPHTEKFHSRDKDETSLDSFDMMTPKQRKEAYEQNE